MMKKHLFPICLFLMVMHTGQAQDLSLDLWPEGRIPHRKPTDETEVRETDGILRISKVQTPAMDLYFADPQKNTGKAVVIFPGGGYHILAYDWEGTEVARRLQEAGISAAVVKYRLPTSRSADPPHRVPLTDAQRAIRLMRYQAEEWDFRPDQIGVMGFSAGGHLAATLSTRYDAVVYGPVDPADKLSARPDFSVLVYPVISFDTGSATHLGSREALLGKSPADSLVRFYAPLEHVNRNTPPAFLLHAFDDEAVPPENSLVYCQKLREAGVPATLHLYPEGGHGFALARDKPYLGGWTGILIDWLTHLRP